MMNGNASGGQSGFDSPVSSSTKNGSSATTPVDKQSVTDRFGKRKRVSNAISGGLRELSFIVCKKVETKGVTTYSEVADEIIAEYATTSNITKFSVDKFDEKNIRRRVYDALNVFMVLDIVTKDGKEIHWRGLPIIRNPMNTTNEVLRSKQMIAKKVAHLNELKQQIANVQNLVVRNQLLRKSGKLPSKGFYLPFILAQTSSHATVEIEISEDMRSVYMDFNSTPFTLYYDVDILQLMRLHQRSPETRHVSRSPSSAHSSTSSDDVSG